MQGLRLRVQDLGFRNWGLGRDLWYDHWIEVEIATTVLSNGTWVHRGAKPLTPLNLLVIQHLPPET